MDCYGGLLAQHFFLIEKWHTQNQLKLGYMINVSL